ncbi:MAG: hypothetical protein ACREPY_17995 [Rhodanobacteraceae bacterium]
MGKYEEFIAELSALGQTEVQSKLAQGIWANKHLLWAESWLRDAHASRKAEIEAAGVDAAKEANAIARASVGAARSSRNAAWIAAWAAIVAATVAVVALIVRWP